MHCDYARPHGICVKATVAVNHRAKSPAENGLRSGSADSGGHQRKRDDADERSKPRSPIPRLHVLPADGRKLILHFDARNTIFVADLFSRITVEMALNTYISGVVWGVTESDGRWRCISDSLSPNPPRPDATSLYKLFEKDIVRVPEDRQRLRETLGNFTEKPHGQKFRPVFQEKLAKLRWPYAGAKDQLTVTGKDGSAYHYLLPSFLNLVQALVDSGRPFCVMIRTFGRDAPHILNALRLMVQGRHPGYSQVLPIPISLQPEAFDRIRPNEFQYRRSDGSVLRSEREVYNHWNACDGIMAVVDDFQYWQANGYHYTAAKLLWHDPSDSGHQHVMFDDNIRVHDDDNIINVKVFDRSDKASDCSPRSVEKLENALFVTANLIESISDPNYFIDKVVECESNYSALL